MFSQKIKDGLLNNEKGVYTDIIRFYTEEIIRYRLQFFIDWLYKELEIPKDVNTKKPDLINYQSLSSAKKRHKNFLLEYKKSSGKKSADIVSNSNTKGKEISTSKFTDPSKIKEHKKEGTLFG